MATMTGKNVAASQINAAAVTGGVLFKLLTFSVMLGVVPIGSYFATLDYVWQGNTTMAAITAVVSANVVLLAYIVLSIIEDGKAAAEVPVNEDEDESKKDR